MKLNPLNSALVAAGVLAMGSAGAFSLPWQNKSADKPATVVAAATDSHAVSVPLAAAEAPNYREIFKQNAPAVVNITVDGVHKVSAEEGGLPPGIENDPFFQFFKGIPGFQMPRGGGQAQPFHGLGSGFIISSDGLILTNAHVVREAKEVTVKLQDRREFKAKVLGSDPVTDVAVLKIDAKDLPVVHLGSAKDVQVGDPVMAIGAPFGFTESATQGIISAKSRSLPGDSVVPFIQTDAAVNPGNSGGPLFDAQGQVVGINAQIFSRTGGYEGLSFSIPIDVAMKVKDQIVATGKAEHGRLGVTVQDLNQGLAESFGLDSPNGALVSQVMPGSAAAAAGLKAGDVITAVNGQPLARSGSLSSVIGMSAPGTKVDLTVWRNHESMQVQAKLGGIQEDQQLASAGGAAQGEQLGLALRPLTKDERAQAHIGNGLVVEDVAGAARNAGIQPGDVITAINGKPVSSVDQIQEVLKRKPKSVALLVNRDGNQIFVPVPLG